MIFSKDVRKNLYSTLNTQTLHFFATCTLPQKLHLTDKGKKISWWWCKIVHVTNNCTIFFSCFFWFGLWIGLDGWMYGSERSVVNKYSFKYYLVSSALPSPSYHLLSAVITSILSSSSSVYLDQWVELSKRETTREYFTFK